MSGKGESFEIAENKLVAAACVWRQTSSNPHGKLLTVKSQHKVDDANSIWLEATRQTIHKIPFHDETAEGTLNFNQSDETQLWRVTKNFSFKVHHQETNGELLDLHQLIYLWSFRGAKAGKIFANASLKLLERAYLSLSSARWEDSRRNADEKVIWVLSCRDEKVLLIFHVKILCHNFYLNFFKMTWRYCVGALFRNSFESYKISRCCTTMLML